jgi:heme-degrading monooxygenase HmoA
MITEIAQIEVKPGLEAEFEAAVKKATPIFKRSKGCHGMELRRSVEKPSRYRLFVSWETVEDHTVGFRNSPEFQEWRGLVGHCYASPPEVEHVHQVVHGLGFDASARRCGMAGGKLAMTETGHDGNWA